MKGAINPSLPRKISKTIIELTQESALTNGNFPIFKYPAKCVNWRLLSTALYKNIKGSMIKSALMFAKSPDVKRLHSSLQFNQAHPHPHRRKAL